MPSQHLPARRLLLAATLASLAGGLSCASSMSAAGQLDESLRAYHHHLLGGDLDRATAYVASKALDAFFAVHGDEKHPVIIEDFQILSVRFLPVKDRKAKQTAVVMVGADVRAHDSITIKAIRYRQLWEQNGERWILADEKIAKTRGPDREGDGEPPRTAPETEDSPD